ncbi:transposase [Enterococcus hirae]|uniref:transposase n=1 Tax=Lactococcus lactis TaxID=1358 RepID=UPI002B1CBD2D|nr:transposase [Lactococcus lactis]
MAADNNIKIIEIETDKDHIQLLTECTPQHYVLKVVKVFKGIFARFLLKSHQELKQRLWSVNL